MGETGPRVVMTNGAQRGARTRGAPVTDVVVVAVVVVLVVVVVVLPVVVVVVAVVVVVIVVVVSRTKVVPWYFWIR